MKVTNLMQPASRILFTAIVNCAKHYQKPIVYGLLLPLVQDPTIGLAQVEVINRVVKDCPPDILFIFLR